MPGQPSFVLRPITEADVASCAAVADQAFKTDRQTQLKSCSPTDPYDHEEGMKAAMSHWHHRPAGAVEMTMAVDQLTGETLGFVVWGFRGFNSAAADAQHEQELEQAFESEHEQASKSGPILHMQEVETYKSARRRLEAYTTADTQTWMKRLMPAGTKCMYVCSIAVHPQHQGRGVGSALIRKGTERADAEGVFCWVHSSESGAATFAKHGFEEVGRLELDLDYWNTEKVPAPGGPDDRWGAYAFRYMRRSVK